MNNIDAAREVADKIIEEAGTDHRGEAALCKEDMYDCALEMYKRMTKDHVLVPREPTEEDMKRFCIDFHTLKSDNVMDGLKELRKAMLATYDKAISEEG